MADSLMVPRRAGRVRTFVQPLHDVPELHLIGELTTTPSPPQALGTHSHEYMEICYLQRGNVRWWAGSEWSDVGAGDLYVTYPGEAHGGADRSLTACTLYWAQLPLPSAAEGYLRLPRGEADDLLRRLRSLEPRCFAAPVAVHDVLERVMQAVASPRDAGAPTRVRALVTQLLLAVVDAGGHAREANESAIVSEAKRLMDGHLSNPLTLGEIASQVGCALSVLKRRFSGETGTTPANYYLRRRMREASRRLRETDDAVSTIAAELGFSSSQYFATAYRRASGTAPTAARMSSATWPDQPIEAPRAQETPGEYVDRAGVWMPLDGV